jgi:TonB family protein
MEKPAFEYAFNGDTALKKAVIISLALHLAVFPVVIAVNLLTRSTRVVKKVYLFDVVDLKAPPRVEGMLRKPETAPKKQEVKKAKVKEKKAISYKKSEKNKEKAKEEPKEEAKEEETKTTSEPLKNAMTIGRPDFPFNFYHQQIIAAVERNWNPPQELLGSEMQVAVTVRFTLLKSGLVTDLTITESSWNSILDKLALRAIEKAKIPPIPGTDTELTITYRLVLHRS